MRKLLLLVIIIMAFFGCSKDDDSSMDRSCWVNVQVKSTNYDSVKLYVAAFAIFPHVVSGKFWKDSIKINGVTMNENMQGHLLYRTGKITDTVAILRTKKIDPRGFRITVSSSCINLSVRTIRDIYIPHNFTMEMKFNANGKNGKIPEVKKSISSDYSIDNETEIQWFEREIGYWTWTDKPFDIINNRNHFDSKFDVCIRYVGHSTDGNFIILTQNGTTIYGE